MVDGVKGFPYVDKDRGEGFGRSSLWPQAFLHHGVEEADVRTSSVSLFEPPLVRHRGDGGLESAS